MILVEAVLGNAADPQWAARLAAAAVDELALDHWEAQKNRFRKKTAGGVELGREVGMGSNRASRVTGPVQGRDR